VAPTGPANGTLMARRPYEPATADPPRSQPRFATGPRRKAAVGQQEHASAMSRADCGQYRPGADLPDGHAPDGRVELARRSGDQRPVPLLRVTGIRGDLRPLQRALFGAVVGVAAPQIAAGVDDRAKVELDQTRTFAPIPERGAAEDVARAQIDASGNRFRPRPDDVEHEEPLHATSCRGEAWRPVTRPRPGNWSRSGCRGFRHASACSPSSGPGPVSGSVLPL
jgi:hypothetical protein